MLHQKICNTSYIYWINVCTLDIQEQTARTAGRCYCHAHPAVEFLNLEWRELPVLEADV